MISVSVHMKDARDLRFVVEHVRGDDKVSAHDILRVESPDSMTVVDIYGNPGAFDLISPIHETRAEVKP